MRIPLPTLFPLMIAASILAACSGKPDEAAEVPNAVNPPETAAAGPDPAALDGRIWRFETVAGEPLAEDVEVTLELAMGDRRLSGLAACNRYTAGFTLEGDVFEVQLLASTKRACPEPLMAAETRFLEALRAARSIAVDDGRLVLVDSSGARSTAREAPGPASI